MTTRSLCRASLGVVSLIATALPVTAGSVTLEPVQDTSLYAEDATSNALHPHIFAGRTNSGNNRRGLMQFDIAGNVPPGSTITSASLRLYCTASPFGGATTTVSVHKLTNAWAEGTSNNDPATGGVGAPATPGDATWINRVHPGTPWTTPGGEIVLTASSSRTVPTGLTAYVWTGAQLGVDVQDWLDNPSTNYGWILVGDEGTNRTARRFGSRQNTDPNFRPQLTIEFDVGFPSFCDGADGSLASCPCGNAGNPDTGCDIQQGTGGVRLDVVAQETTPSNRVTMSGTGFPAASSPTAIVIRAPSLDAGAPIVFGDGLRCIGVPLVRLGAAFANAGTSTHTFGHGTMAGSGNLYYQLWFRNTPAMFCTPDAFNLSNGRTLVW